MCKSLVAALLLIHTIYGQTNYCSPTLCSAGVPHIGCNNTGISPKNCTDPRLVFMNQTDINSILQMHNECRSKFANGSMRGFSSAVRMPQLIWNAELAKLAQLSVRTCQVGDRCRNTATFKYVGQNKIVSGGYPYWIANDIAKHGTTWDYLINTWFTEYIKATQSDLDLLKVRAANLPIITHFTNIVNDRVTEVGCAALIYDFDYFSFNLISVCNYNYANVVGKSAYTKGAVCSKCTKGCNKLRYPGLCNPGEIVV